MARARYLQNMEPWRKNFGCYHSWVLVAAIPWTSAVFLAVHILVSSPEYVLSCTWHGSTSLTGETELRQESPWCIRSSACLLSRAALTRVWISLPNKGEQPQEISPTLRPATVFSSYDLKPFLWLVLNTLSYSSPDTDSSFEETNGGRATGQCGLGSMLGSGYDSEREREREYCAVSRLRQAVSHQKCRDHACRLA